MKARGRLMRVTFLLKRKIKHTKKNPKQNKKNNRRKKGN